MQKGSGNKRVTLRDVAKEAGFSVQTTSHVLSGNQTVILPEITKIKIREAAKKLGYIPNPLAQAIRSGKTNTIAIWMPIDRPIMAYLRMLQIIGEKAKESSYDIVILGLDRKSALTTTGKAPYSWPADAIISIDSEKAVEVYRSKSASNIPVSILGFQEFENGDSVAWDVVGAAKKATQTFIEKGRKNIAHLTLNWIIEEFPREQRRRGYTEAIQEVGAKPIFIVCKEETAQSASEAINSFLKSGGAVDALTCFSDTLAVGAIQALIQNGRQIPEDCLVYGFGNYPEAESCQIPISTIAPPFQQVISQAFDWLLDRIETPNQPSRFELLPMQHIDRQSTD